jgi:hypothetical protein
LRVKLKTRDSDRYAALAKVQKPDAHPLFRVVRRGVSPWEKGLARRSPAKDPQ